jgi:hypothetical protein
MVAKELVSLGLNSRFGYYVTLALVRISMGNPVAGTMFHSAAPEHNEPAGQIASRELELVRIKGAVQRAEELSDDVAAAIEGVL